MIIPLLQLSTCRCGMLKTAQGKRGFASESECQLRKAQESGSCRHTKQLVDASNRRKHAWGSCPINTLFKPNILDDWFPKCPARVSCHETLGEQQVEGHSQLLLTISLSGMYGLISFDKFMEHDGGWNCTLPPFSPKLAFEDLKLTMCFSTCSEPTPEKNGQQTHPAKSESRTIPMKRDTRYSVHQPLYNDMYNTRHPEKMRDLLQ